MSVRIKIVTQKVVCFLFLHVTGATSRMAHLEKIGHFFQVRRSQSVLIFSILNHPLLLLLWCFSTLVNDYFEVSFNSKVILFITKIA